MADVMDKKKAPVLNDTKPKEVKQTDSAAKDELKVGPRFGLVEMILILLLAGVIFIFIFGLRQMRIEKAEIARTQNLFEQILPTFEKVSAAAKAYQAKDEFGAWPIDISELFPPSEVDTKEFKFTINDSGVVTATSTKEFGKEGIKVNYNIPGKSFEIDDPNPDAKPNVLDSWLPEE